MSGVLYVVATPIGNLADLTRRAEQVLKEVDLIAAEDTRHTRQLLSALGLHKPLQSHHEHNEAKSAGLILAELKRGATVALVTDAGTPGLSDPGVRLVRSAQEAGIQVVPVPGASAVAAALSVAGIEGEEFVFYGFLPAKRAARRQKLKEVQDRPERLVFFEAPHRLAESLQDMAEILGDRPAAVLRELTKVHEEIRRAPLSALAAEFGGRPVKGEITLVVSGSPAAAEGEREGLEEELRVQMAGGKIPLKRLAAELAQRRNLSRNEVYRLALRIQREVVSAPGGGPPRGSEA